MTTTPIHFEVNYPHPPRLLRLTERMETDLSVTGRGVTIAFVDSGFAPHPALKKRIKRYVDASSLHIQEYREIQKIDMFSWHGQMTSFIAASDGVYPGLAHEADVVLVRVTSENNTIHEDDIRRGMDWLAQRHRQVGVRVVNVSVGGDFPNNDPNHFLHRSVNRLVKEGVVVVVAAGNGGSHTLVPPATAPGAIIVGGYDDQNTTSREEWFGYHNNYGNAYDGTPKPDLIAPAAWLASPILADSDMARDAKWLAPLIKSDSPQKTVEAIIETGFSEMKFVGNANQLPMYRIQRLLQERIYKHKLIDAHHQHVDGTSVAAPIVSSVVAQMLEVNPALTPEQVKQILMETATPLDGIPSEQQGAGMVNPRAAVKMASKFKTQ